MEKVQKATRDSKYAFKSVRGPKPRSTNADDVAEVCGKIIKRERKELFGAHE